MSDSLKGLGSLAMPRKGPDRPTKKRSMGDAAPNPQHGVTARKNRSDFKRLETMENEFVNNDNPDHIIDPTVLNMDRAEITTNDLDRLRQTEGIGAWLNDNVIMGYLINELPKIDARVLIVDPVIWNNRYSEYPRNMRELAFPEYREDWSYVVIPINKNNTHWFLAISDRNGHVRMYDTFGGVEGDYRRKLTFVVRELIGSRIPMEFDYVDISTYYQQTDFVSCGPAVCMLAERFLKNEYMKWWGDEILVWRRHALEILQDRAYDPEERYAGLDLEEVQVVEPSDVGDEVHKVDQNEVCILSNSSSGSKKKKRMRISGRTQRQKNRERMRVSRDNETNEQKEKRLQACAGYERKIRKQEKPEQKMARNRDDTNNKKKWRSKNYKEMLDRYENIARRPLEREEELKDNEKFNKVNIGDLTAECSNCGALYFESERVGNQSSFNKCCKGGPSAKDAKKVKENLTIEKFNPFVDYPSKLYDLWVRNNKSMSKMLFKCERSYNSAFAFGSLRAETHDKSVWPYCYRIQGQIYSTVNLAAHPENNENRRNAQLFFIDSEEAIDIRMEHKANKKCDKAVMKEIDDILKEVSPYYKAYKIMHEVEEEQNERAKEEGIDPPELRLVFDLKANVDKRRYNIPKSNEVAAVFVLDHGDEVPPAEGIIIHQYGKEIVSLTKFDKRTESMLYPLYFPLGIGGVYKKVIGQKKIREKTVNEYKSVVDLDNGGVQDITFAQYYRFMTAIRRPRALVKCGKRRVPRRKRLRAYKRIEKAANALIDDSNYFGSKKKEDKMAKGDAALNPQLGVTARKNRSGSQSEEGDEEISDSDMEIDKNDEEMEVDNDNKENKEEDGFYENGLPKDPLENYEWAKDNVDLSDFNPLRLGKKLYQQYWVDAYVKVEQDRLDYIRTHQMELKAENYTVLKDYLEKTADEKGKKVGKTIILPASFKGSPRDRQQGYQDNMTIVRRYGKPDLFITFTCNPNWPEIQRNLLPGNRAMDEPDLLCRVFHEYLKELKKDIFKQDVFGKAIAWTYVVEFQKRGLPHAHILVILDKDSKIRTVEDMDKIVSAEIPDMEKFQRLHETVTSHMMHGPCGAHDLKSACMAEDRHGRKYCTKEFPKEFREETSAGNDSYAKYRRSDNGVYVEKNGVKMDNRWVVPYNPYLCLKYGAHINVEICASVKAVKYLYKYCYKGHDCAKMVLEKGDSLEHDETKTFMDMRYVTPHEAFWRIFEYALDEKSHSIIRLDLHLPDQEAVYYRPDDDIYGKLEKVENRHTTLTGWFELNKTKSDYHEYLYHEIPEYCTFNKYGNDFGWKPRIRSAVKSLGRMYTVNPKQGEIFYLRLLLLHVKGAQSWKDLLTYEDLTYPTFRESVMARGLMDNGEVWAEYFREVVDTAINTAMIRELFVMIIQHAEDANVVELWNEFKEHMSIDFFRKYGYENIEDDEDIENIEDSVDEMKKKRKEEMVKIKHIAENLAKADIQRQLEVNNMSLADFGISLPVDVDISDLENWDRNAELADGQKMRESMNGAQENVVAYVFEKLKEKASGQLKNGCVFIDGPGGSGKTYTYRTLVHLFRGYCVKYKTSSWMGIAAHLLPDGRTMHKTFGLPFMMNKNSSLSAKPNNKLGQELIETAVFIVDEISMVPRHVMEAIDRKLKELMENDLPFGGKVMIIGGDFRQILPIERRAGRSELVSLSVRQSVLWEHFKVFHLKDNWRAKLNQKNESSEKVETNFADYILKMGNGEIEADDEDYIDIPEELIVKGDLIDEVFGDCMGDYVEMAKRVILTTTNDKALEINNTILESLNNGHIETYYSVDTVDNNEPSGYIEYPDEFLHSLNEGGLPPHELKLMKNSVVIMLRNLNPAIGLCNGTRLLVKEMHRRHLECEILTGDRKGKRVLIPRITVTSSEGKFPFMLYRRQFPIKLCYAMTINKSQGQTIDNVGLDLVDSVFSHGMTYVGFSRASGWNCIKVAADPERENKIKNIVWKEVLLQEDSFRPQDVFSPEL